jgi:oligoribonuclease
MDRYKSNLVWIDLEMTGLNPEVDAILEIATIVTNNELDILGTGPSLAIHQEDTQLAVMDEWNKNQHGRSGLIDAVRASSVTISQAEEQTLAFLKEYCEKNSAPLCGNSVWQDRIFLRKYMPRLDDFLHYRIIDVSSIKEAIKRWYPGNPYENFVKTENHRAQEDIVQSIEELKHYRTYFFCEKSQ